MDRGFNRQWSRHGESEWHQHRGHRGGPPWGGWGAFTDGPWSGRGRPGPPPWVAGLFGLAQGEQQRGPRVRRGDVRAAILHVLSAEAMNGYQLISTIAERTRGEWKPSPGSVYPTISQLEDEGLVEGTSQGSRRTLTLTPEGREYVAAHREELESVWSPFADGERDDAAPDYRALKPELGQLMSAVWQIVTTGTDQQRRDAIDILVDTRRRLYGLLAEDGEDRS